MWENYIVGETPARRIVVSEEFKEILLKFRKEKGMAIQFIFEDALVALWRIWNAQGESNECESHVTEMKVRKMLVDSNPPGEGFTRSIYIQFRGSKTYSWFTYMERLRMFEQPADGIRRIITWFLKEQGFI